MDGETQDATYVRVIELPPVRMARSGTAALAAFDAWWSAAAEGDRHSLFPRDFMWYDPSTGRLEWLYALPAGQEDTGGFAVFDFPGGLYAVAACRDAEADIERTTAAIHAWVAASDAFEAASASNDPGYPRYDMGHVVTPKNALETLGYHQTDLFVPIVPRRRG